MKAAAAKKRDLSGERHAMVERQIVRPGVRDELVLEAVRKVPREAFLPEGLREFAYEDSPLPMEEGQTISQPSIVALMSEALRRSGGEKVLEIGTGSGYAAAVLAQIAAEVYAVSASSRVTFGDCLSTPHIVLRRLSRANFAPLSRALRARRPTATAADPARTRRTTAKVRRSCTTASCSTCPAGGSSDRFSLTNSGHQRKHNGAVGVSRFSYRAASARVALICRNYFEE